MRCAPRPRSADLDAAVTALQQLKMRRARRADVAQLANTLCNMQSTPSIYSPAAVLPQRRAPLPPADAEEIGSVIEGALGAETYVLAATAALQSLARRRTLGMQAVEQLLNRYAAPDSRVDLLAVINPLLALPQLPEQPLTNAALRACCRAGNASAAWDMFMHVQQLSIWPDAGTAAALVTVLADSGEWARSVEVYTRMLRSRIHVDGEACHALLRALQRAGEWRVAEAALLCALPVSPFNTLADTLHELGDNGDPAGDRAAHQLLNLSYRSVAPLVVTLSPEDSPTQQSPGAPKGAFSDTDGTSLDHPTTIGPDGEGETDAPKLKLRPEMPLSTRKSLRLLGSPAATACCNAVLQSYRDASPPQATRARTLLSAMAQADQCNRIFTCPGLDVDSISITIDAHIALGSPDNAWSLLCALGEMRMQPDQEKLEGLLATACRAQHGDDPTMRLWQGFKFQGALPEGVCCVEFLVAATHAATGASGHDALQRCAQRLGGEWACAISNMTPLTASNISLEAGTMLAVLAGGTAAAADVHRTLLEAGVAVSFSTIVLCCEHHAQRRRRCCEPSVTAAAVRQGGCGAAHCHQRRF
eukprot:jgi/Ulvmu1/8652/UM046_0057.1